MKLRKNSNPKWTIQHINHIKKYGKNSYGLKDSILEALDEELIRIKKGNPTLRVDNDTMECYEIYYNNNLVGDITLAERDDALMQLDISVFDEYSNNGIATKAIVTLLEKENIKMRLNRIEAVILDTNPNAKKIIHILEKCGFIYNRIICAYIYQIS